nr:Hypothetical protein [Pseudomonas aeruginosa]
MLSTGTRCGDALSTGTIGVDALPGPASERTTTLLELLSFEAPPEVPMLKIPAHAGIALLSGKRSPCQARYHQPLFAHRSRS